MNLNDVVREVVIIAKEASTPDYEPVDGSQYTPTKDFGKSIEYGVKNYIVYNSNGTNFVKVDSLKPGKTYYFSIIEHDNNSNSTLYYTNNPPTISVTTHSLNLNFNLETSIVFNPLYDSDSGRYIESITST